MKELKGYTDLEQSEKLAEILSLESADMCYPLPCEDGDKPLLEQGGLGSTPCWSLAALINILERGALFKTPQGWTYQAYVESKAITSNYYSNPIDACVEIILELHKQKLL